MNWGTFLLLIFRFHKFLCNDCLVSTTLKITRTENNNRNENILSLNVDHCNCLRNVPFCLSRHFNERRINDALYNYCLHICTHTHSRAHRITLTSDLQSSRISMNHLCRTNRKLKTLSVSDKKKMVDFVVGIAIFAIHKWTETENRNINSRCE